MVRGQVLEDRLTGSSERLSAVIRDRAEDAVTILDAAAARWGEQFDARESQLRGAVSNQNDALESLFDQSTRRLVGAISAEGALAQAQIEASASQSIATLSSESAQINERLASLAIDAAAAAANGAGNVHEALSERIAAFDHIVNQRAVSLVEAVSQQTERMREHLQALDGLVGESGHSVIDRLGSHTDEFNAQHHRTSRCNRRHDAGQAR